MVRGHATSSSVVRCPSCTSWSLGVYNVVAHLGNDREWLTSLKKLEKRCSQNVLIRLVRGNDEDRISLPKNPGKDINRTVLADICGAFDCSEADSEDG